MIRSGYFLLLLFCGSMLQGQRLPGPEIICYSSNEVHHTRILPPQYSARNSQNPRSEFLVEYIGFSEEAMVAFQHAVDLWEAIIVSDVPIRIQANWQSLGAGVLGSASSNGSFRNFSGAPYKDIDYPVALAEKLARKNLNASFEADIMANFSSNINWYYGLDGNTPTGQYDLVSVVMHEIGHGLGIAGSFGANVTQEIAGHSLITGFPRIYDTYLTTGGQTPVIDREVYSDGAAIYQAITSNSLIFRSAFARETNGSVFPRIYSPNPFNGGSSVSHLDEQTFLAGNPNSLMTPFIGQAEAIHDPGEVLMAMMIDMGWEYAFFDHAELTDTEDLSSPILFQMELEADMQITAGSMELVYHDPAVGLISTAAMTLTDGRTYQYSLNNPGEGELEYWFQVEDEYGRTIQSPDRFVFKIGPDEEAPKVGHTPIGSFRKFGNDELPPLAVSFSDNLGVESAILEYRLNGGEISVVNLLENEPTLTIEFSSLEFGDIIEYRFVVTDASAQSNQTIMPADGYFSLLIIDVIQDNYSTDFELGGQAFNGSGFATGQELGFENQAIHSEHPYSTETDYILDFVGEVIIDHRDVIVSYDDIALIEPGIPGSVFGISAFRDYIVLEASKDKTIWTPLDGYDATRETAWLSVYNSLIQDENSIAPGSTDLFKPNEILLSEFFKNGDLVFLRFRLHSDATRYGWGWAMDNFSIEYREPVLGMADTNKQPLYPNPVTHTLTFQNVVIGSHYQIFDASGQERMSGMVTEVGLDVSDLSAGLYVVSIRSNRGLESSKFIKK